MSEERLQRRLEREKNARLEAERILEAKSRELFDRNEELRALSASLEKQVINRTRDLMAARDEALAAVKAKSQFIANMSHEIRTPLNGVLGMINMLSESPLKPEQEKLTNTAQQAGQHLLEIVNDILDFSKIDAGEMKLHFEPVDIVALVKQSHNTMHPVAVGKGIALRKKLPDTFPSRVSADALRLRQVLTNLLSNAIKFTNTGEVVIELSRLDQQYVLQVTDSGIGMSDEQIGRIFNAFGQADGSITREFGGTGLGLTITQNFIHLMGGSIEVSSTPGQGSVFTITLPLEECDENHANVSALVSENTRFEPARILVVEDNDVNLEIARYLLEKTGLQVDAARNGQEAVEAVQKAQYPIVLMDIQMPVLDGLAATKKIRSLGFSTTDLPILAMTAHASAEHRQDSLDAGMNLHLTKPLDPIQLYQALAEYLPIRAGQVEEVATQSHSTAATDKRILDIEQALNRLGGNQQLYQRVCQTFVTKHEHCIEELQEHCQSQTYGAAMTLAHTLKGSAANISANEFSRHAGQLEKALKDKQLEDLQKHLAELARQWKKLLPELQAYVGISDSNNEQSAPFDHQEFQSILLKLQHSIHADVSEADAQLQSLLEMQLPDSVSPAVNQLQQALDIFDIPQADAVLKTLLAES